MYMSDFEICQEYRLARKGTQKAQIEILADRNLCGQKKIVEILLRGGEAVQALKPPCPSGAKEQNAQRLALYQQGLNDQEIARKLGCNPKTIWQWRYNHHLPKNKENKK